MLIKVILANSSWKKFRKISKKCLAYLNFLFDFDINFRRRNFFTILLEHNCRSVCLTLKSLKMTSF